MKEDDDDLKTYATYEGDSVPGTTISHNSFLLQTQIYTLFKLFSYKLVIVIKIELQYLLYTQCQWRDGNMIFNVIP